MQQEWLVTGVQGWPRPCSWGQGQACGRGHQATALGSTGTPRAGRARPGRARPGRAQVLLQGCDHASGSELGLIIMFMAVTAAGAGANVHGCDWGWGWG